MFLCVVDATAKVENGGCAESCIPSRLGFCSRSIIVSLGGLEAGTCTDAGFTVLAGTSEQAAGPCGNLEFNTFESGSAAAAFAASFVATSCETFRRVEN